LTSLYSNIQNISHSACKNARHKNASRQKIIYPPGKVPVPVRTGLRQDTVRILEAINGYNPTNNDATSVIMKKFNTIRSKYLTLGTNRT
jgi:hypothetical protein